MNKRITNEKEMFKDKVILAFIIDDEVVDTFVADERFAAILQSSPKILEIEPEGFTLNGPFRGWAYDGEKFYPPNVDTKD